MQVLLQMLSVETPVDGTTTIVPDLLEQVDGGEVDAVFSVDLPEIAVTQPVGKGLSEEPKLPTTALTWHRNPLGTDLFGKLPTRQLLPETQPSSGLAEDQITGKVEVDDTADVSVAAQHTKELERPGVHETLGKTLPTSFGHASETPLPGAKINAKPGFVGTPTLHSTPAPPNDLALQHDDPTARTQSNTDDDARKTQPEEARIENLPSPKSAAERVKSVAPPTANAYVELPRLGDKERLVSIEKADPATASVRLLPEGEISEGKTIAPSVTATTVVSDHIKPTIRARSTNVTVAVPDLKPSVPIGKHTKERGADIPAAVIARLEPHTKAAQQSATVVYRPIPAPNIAHQKAMHVSREPISPIEVVQRPDPSSPASPASLLATMQLPKTEFGRRGYEIVNAQLSQGVKRTTTGSHPQTSSVVLPKAQSLPSPTTTHWIEFDRFTTAENTAERGDLADLSRASDPTDTRRQNMPLAKLDVPVRPVMHQLANAARYTSDGGIEVRLSPEELGRVRLSLSPGEASVTVLITAERPETLELIRRNIEMFAGTLRQEGFTDLAFSFGDAREDQHYEERVDLDQSLSGNTDQHDTTEQSIGRSTQLLSSGQLDIRL